MGAGPLAQTRVCCMYQGAGGGNIPHWVLLALVLIFCRVVSHRQADVWIYMVTSYFRCREHPSLRFGQAMGVSDLG